MAVIASRARRLVRLLAAAGLLASLWVSVAAPNSQGF